MLEEYIGFSIVIAFFIPLIFYVYRMTTAIGRNTLRTRQAKIYATAPVTPEEHIFRRVNEIVDFNYSSINAPKSEEYVTNNRNLKLHVRSFWPDGETIAVLISLHGFASHISRPTHFYLAEKMNEQKIAYITIDFHGHGYSDGVRGLVSDPDDLVDDVLSVILAIYSPDSKLATLYNVKKTAPLGMPLFLMGHSMGGATATLVSNLLSRVDENSLHTRFSYSRKEEIAKIATNFRGALLFCPAFVVIDLPSSVVSFLDRWIAPLFATVIVPGGSTNIDDNRLIWVDDAYIDYIVGDGFPANPDGLSWGPNPRIKTATTILSLCNKAKSTAESTSYPFVIFHDSKEEIVKIRGTQTFIAEAKSSKKTFVDVDGGLHDLIANKLGFVTSQAVSWILSELY